MKELSVKTDLCGSSGQKATSKKASKHGVRMSGGISILSFHHQESQVFHSLKKAGPRMTWKVFFELLWRESEILLIVDDQFSLSSKIRLNILRMAGELGITQLLTTTPDQNIFWHAKKLFATTKTWQHSTWLSDPHRRCFCVNCFGWRWSTMMYFLPHGPPTSVSKTNDD